MKVKDIMTEKVVVATTNHKVSQVLEFFANFKISHLPVVDENDYVVGIISAKDVIKMVYEEMINEHLQFSLSHLDKQFSIDSLMTKKSIAVKPTDSVRFVAEIFNRNSFHALTVEDKGAIKGIVTTKDLSKAIAKFKEE